MQSKAATVEAFLASQKRHIGLYLFCVYTDSDEETAFRKAWIASGKKLDMGKFCVRFKKLQDIPLDVVGRLFAGVTAKKFVAVYERSREVAAAARKSAKKGKKTEKKAKMAKRHTPTR